MTVKDNSQRSLSFVRATGAKRSMRALMAPDNIATDGIVESTPMISAQVKKKEFEAKEKKIKIYRRHWKNGCSRRQKLVSGSSSSSWKDWYLRENQVPITVGRQGLLVLNSEKPVIREFNARRESDYRKVGDIPWFAWLNPTL